MKKKNKFKSVEAQRFVSQVQAIIDRGDAKSFTEVARSAGFVSQDFTDLKSAKKDLQRDFLDAVASKYKIDKNFILTGEIFVLNGEDNSQVGEHKTVITPNGKITNQNFNKRKSNALIPYYPADFMAGNSDLFYEDGTIYPEYYMDVPEFYGCIAFRAYSDSMEAKIRSGNILFATKVPDWRSHLEFGQIYGITCKDGRRYLKYIRLNKLDETKFLLKSENPTYDDFTLPVSKIKNLWLIEGWLDKRT